MSHLAAAWAVSTAGTAAAASAATMNVFRTIMTFSWVERDARERHAFCDPTLPWLRPFRRSLGECRDILQRTPGRVGDHAHVLVLGLGTTASVRQRGNLHAHIVSEYLNRSHVACECVARHATPPHTQRRGARKQQRLQC